MSKFDDAYRFIFAALQPLGVTPTHVNDACHKAQVIASGRGVNRDSVSGQVIITVSVPAGKGPKDLVDIATKFDNALVGKHFHAGKKSLQFYTSELSASFAGELNRSQLTSEYAITFQFMQGN